jgi:CO/xanthine dehydrogenase Mo-binding subunit
MTALDSVALFATTETRVEGREKVSGRLAYTADLVRPGTLWAGFAISPFAHARIVRIDVDAARAVPGVRAVLTGADIGPRRFGRQLYDWPVLACETVRFLGERVAAVAAETREAAEAAARAIDVTYEELPAVFDPQAALADDAPVLHPEWSSYYFAYLGDRPSPPRAHPNIQGAIVLAKGEADLEPIFARAHRVFEHVFRMPRQHAGYIEPRSTIVWLDDDGRVHVQSPNKTPFSLRRQLARVAGIAEERIVVETSAIGGDFGGKGLTIDEFPCYFLAKATGRPVRYVQTYAEELRNGPTRHRTVATLRTAVAADGTFLAHASTVLYDGGAYAAGKPIPTLVPGNGYGAIPYRVPNVRLDIRTVYTNALPAGHVRGPSEIQTFFAWEQHVEMIAEALGRDSLALRRQNVVRDGDTTLSGEPVAGGSADAVLGALEREMPRTALGPGCARGYAFTCGHTGGGKTAVRATVSADGKVAVVIGVPDQGVGVQTAVQRVMAAALAIAPERIAVRRGSTADALVDPGSGHSRVTHVVGRAAQDAAAQLRARLDAGDVPVTEATFAERARRVCREGPCEVIGTFADPHGDGGSDLSFAAYAVDVQVDRETGALALHDVLFVTDVGQIINPVAHQGQIDGGFIFGLGNALMEEIPLDETGRVGTPSLGEYKLPGMRDVPPFRTILIPAPPGDGPFGAKMAGELSNTGVAPAIANAVYHAAGVRLSEYPLTAERVHAALNEVPAG